MKVHLRKHDLLETAACGAAVRRPLAKAVPELAFAATAEARCSSCARWLLARVRERVRSQDEQDLR